MHLLCGVLEMRQQIFRNLGLTDQPGFDIFTAMVAGLIDQQLGNDPGCGGRHCRNRGSISGRRRQPSLSVADAKPAGD